MSLELEKNTAEIMCCLEVKLYEDQDILTKSYIFVLVTTGLSLSGLDILKEYKTHCSVEKKFQYLISVS